MTVFRQLFSFLLCLLLWWGSGLPAQASGLEPQEEYRLSKYDVINIVIVGFSDALFSQNMGISNNDSTTGGDAATLNDIMIGPDGFVNLPYAGSVKLAGLTVPEATTVLTEKMGRYIKIPAMSVMVKQYGQRKVYVMGEVNQPGIYSLGSEYMNVFAALSSAGGLTKRGKSKEIAVVRIENGEVKMQKLNFNRFVKNQDISQNIKIQDGDMIYVPRSNRIDLKEDIMPMLSVYGLYKTITE